MMPVNMPPPKLPVCMDAATTGPGVGSQELADVQRDMQGLQAPEPSCLPQINEANGKRSAGKEEDQDSTDSREVLDHMVRLEFDIVQPDEDPKATNIFSFYGNYFEYLDEYNLIEVSEFV